MKFLGTATILALTAFPASVLAQEFPSGTIEVVTHSGAGGGTDTTARMMMSSVTEVLGADMVVVSKQGGTGAVAMEYVNSRPADGHTILVWTTGHAVTQAKGSATDAEGFIPIARGTNDPQVLMTKCNSFDGTQAFIDAQTDDTLRYGVTQVANIDDVSAFMFNKAAEIQPPEIIPFEGGGDLLTNLVGGNVDVAVLNYGEAAAQIDAGEVCPMVVMGTDRLATAPETPTTADFATVRGFAVKAGTPDDIVEALRAAIVEGMESDAYVEFLATQGLEPNSVAGADVWGNQMNNSVKQMREALIELGYIKG
ncbi:Bug family tripartite tricarboxylate transporter substrate binding protein [Qingshengfaniella alkalisoli]|uniref:Tripartite tricarboxylate transporter substrate binding protein n=1 Tax=Qingshengfaniella alkalisoli TaxID=2599296 RepID=A0A5B8JAG4_9RHOB|nr:tripartite tricarboxylate transporter substrate binding protein [Qingshengfaniella alkalisoli]QDY71180.1 tripartite tricarboxylate transporter substrate binding protein [Qingshengfaniella alkalisoli]